MDKFPLILTFLSEKVQLSGWNCSPFWDDDTDIEASFSMSFQTARNTWAFIYLLCHLFKQILPAVFGGRFTDGIYNNFSRRIALFHQNIHRKNNSRAALCHD